MWNAKNVLPLDAEIARNGRAKYITDQLNSSS
jgi:hypothetical protein